MNAKLSERGVALMLVLWMIVVLGAVAAAAVSGVRRQTDVVVNLRTRALARAAAESGVVVAMRELRGLYAQSSTPEDLVGLYPQFLDRLQRLGEQRLGAASFQVVALDLNARIDLNHADRPTLTTFLESFVGPGEAGALAGALLDWRDPDAAPQGGAEAEAYRAAGSPFVPPNRPLRRLEELPRIRGFSDEVVEAIAPYVTVWGDGHLNVNTASPRVLEAFPGIGASGAAVLQGARGSDGIRSLSGMRERLGQAGGGTLPPLVGTPQRLLLVSRGWVEGLPLTHETQVVLDVRNLQPGQPGDPFVVMWEERSR